MKKDGTTVAVDKNLLKIFKQKTGFKGSQGLNTLLKSVIDGELNFIDGKWVSVFTRGPIPTSTEIKNIEEPVVEEPIEEVEKEPEPEPDSIVMKKNDEAIESQIKGYKNMMERETFEFNNMHWKAFECDEDIKADIRSMYNFDNLDENKFDKDFCTSIFRAKYGENWKWGDSYKKDPKIDVESLYNFYKAHNRTNVCLYIDSKIKQAVGYMSENREAY